MQTEVWCRNPKTYIREVVEVRHSFVAWDRGFLFKYNIDPIKFNNLYYPKDMHWRSLIIGDASQGAAEVSRGGGSQSRPDAVYPVWEYGDELVALEEMMAHPVGEDFKACSDPEVPLSERPVLGQEHRIIVADLPPVGNGPGRKIARELNDLQSEYPNCILHVHGLYSFRVMFGMSFRSVDIDARTPASKGDVMLPNGKLTSLEKAAEFPQWVTVCGFNPVDLKVPRNRCMFNIKSARWAAKHFKENFAFKSAGSHTPNTMVADSALTPVPVQSGKHALSAASEGDKFLCDTCSLQDGCKFYRQGAVCSVPDSEPVKLASFFNTRDSEAIVDGLGILLAAQANRLERGLDDERYSDDLDSEVSKMINSLFSNGVKLAKLNNPALNGGPKVGVFVNGGHGAQVAVGASASQLTASIVQELEAKGIPRDQITPEMIGRVLDPDAKTNAAIEARSVSEAHRD